MRIKQVSVSKLFGIFDHVIPMNLDDRITIMHGPNGFGKTILLRMISGLFSANYQVFRSIPFNSFTIEFDSGETLTVVREPISATQHSMFPDVEGVIFNYTIITIRSNTTEETYTPSIIDKEQFRSIAPLVDDVIPELDRVGSSRWVNRLNGRVYNIEDIIEVYGDQLAEYIPPGGSNTPPDWFNDLVRNDHIRFVKSNRLYEYPFLSRRIAEKYRYLNESPQTVSTVRQYSDELAKIIQRKLADYAELSQSLDRTFPVRLMKEQNVKLSSEELEERLNKLEVDRLPLIELGILDEARDVPDIPAVEEEYNNVLSVYVQDIEEKLSVFDDLIAPLKVFENIINERFQFKHLKFNKSAGFVFTTSYGQEIHLENLSSGEQHELVLLYQLLFRVKPDSLILIDEPELSLHVAWQRRFLDDLKVITDLGQFDVLIATHSPQIIGDKLDWAVALERPNDEEEEPTSVKYA